MNATIFLQNIDNSLLNAIRSVIKLRPEVKCRISKKNERDDLYCSDEVAAKIQEELAQTKADFLAGKIRAFDCAADFRKAVENGEI